MDLDSKVKDLDLDLRGEDLDLDFDSDCEDLTTSLCVGPGGTYSNINKPNKRKIHTNTLFHLGFVEIISSPHEGVIRGVFP